MKLPRTVREPDVKALLTRAKLDAQINMTYHFRTGKPRDYCFLKFSDANEVGAAIFTLSHFTLAGSDLKPARFGNHSALLADPHLLAGWSPSPTSDLSSRVIREPIREPPKLLATILAEQWVSFTRVKDSPEDPTEIAQAFYKRFHQFDVVGIWLGNSKYKDKCLCKILFGNSADAKAARKMYLEGSSEHRPGYAKIYRAGPDDHQKLIKYRSSLPKDLPAAEVGDLLEEKYRQLHMTPEDVQRWKDYPTPESAVGCKGGKPTVEAV
ncbi:hypothetical protein C7974DRAFT_410766 [Boeremia exigua]|uniref:uncharacterized protein n=1 Tax=Boeremia exigua TaxID=749465 RepID=UPI001E8E0A9B|nr:uncharacterized protein C7974DRAFT_410766 [Boeremia exigua]KAH6639812.1 hypothetical protein C7974DRAFT_410766 [Boeremia exigua]